ncbi:E3 ubiquitin-protein ligase UBR2-like [Tubulanus polymorphus]|uniref:E3 ubiquitin-protein ligase UBR2-like n=1 Tax=Tubulanus polymorphus TaxID=672921 RepID=UPI003DA5E321
MAENSPPAASIEFNRNQILQDFNKAFETDTLDDALKSHFRHYVPDIYTAAVSPDTEKEDRKAKKILFSLLETFICAGDPNTVFQELKGMDHPPALCGHVFKMGEPTYSCRDCGTDPTCVLCIQCFQKSVHKDHKYRMSTSGGGGYCDCGDAEAWKSDPYCNIHQPGQQTKQASDPVELLPLELKQRTEKLYRCLVEYSLHILTWDHPDSLPPNLNPINGMDDTYVTMLFNDEVHTYEQVITTLQRAVDCTKKEAMDFATTVDREGRSIVRVGKHSDCERARSTIERQTSRHGNRPLKCLVMHTSVVAHQLFAIKILGWLQEIVSKSDGLRNLFCDVAFATSSISTTEGNFSFIERALLQDTQYWKVARIQVHQLIMSGVLMDAEYKKRFAILFTKLYPFIIKDFIKDDHEHSISVVSEAVQIFTVPTLARMLIMEHDLISVILRAFLNECQSKKRRDGKFAFERNERSQAFRRAQYMLYDLKYALSCKPSPEEWNDNLRENFINGFNVFLELLKCMQGMDSVTRQTGQHLEFEPEWEVAFNLQLKLSGNIALLLQWCGSDKYVLIEAYKAVIDVLYQCRDQFDSYNRQMCTVAGKEANCIKYDVASQPISIHLSLNRILAGLHLYLEQHGLSFFSEEISLQTKLRPIELIEPGLRAQVMIAQTQAGMWRRNGYSLLNQIFFYSNVRCRTEMYDRDIQIIQAGASLIESNEFMIHLLNKFNLLAWIREEYDQPGGSPQDDLVRQTVIIAEEFLNLLIILLGERYVPNIGYVSQADSLKREVVHQLCIHPMAHSEISKSLPEDHNDETGLDQVLHHVADFKKPVGTGKGLFELKEEQYEHYNPYFYHYTRAEQTKSEEAQRKRKKQANEDQALPPPYPPPFSQAFSTIVNLLHCDVMIYLIKIILKRTAATRSRSWSETQFEKTLHLIGLALYEDKRQYDNGERAFCFVEKATVGANESIISQLEQLVGNHNLAHDAQKDLLSWVLKTFAEVCKLKDSTVAMDHLHTTGVVKDEKLEKEKKKKAEMAAKRRNRIMAQMSMMQRNFIMENAELFESTSSELQPASSDMDISQASDTSPVCIGSKQSGSNYTGVQRMTCILCQEQEDLNHDGRAMVLATFVQRSTVLSSNRERKIKNVDEYDPLFMPADLFCGTHSSTCGHVMHADCWQTFFDSVLMQERRRMFRLRHHPSFDIEKMEFLCPLCETISNTVIPIVPSVQSLLKECDEKKEIDLSLNDWLDGLLKTVEASVQEAEEKEVQEESFLLQPCPLPLITKMMADSVAKNFQMLYEYVYETEGENFSESIINMVRKFSCDVYSVGLGLNPDDTNCRVPILAWSTCAYTIQTIEQCLRNEGKPLFGAMTSRQLDCLNALTKFAAVCNQVQTRELVKKHCIRLLTALFHKTDFKPKSPAPCIIDFDMFHYFIYLCLTLPTLYTEDQKSSFTIMPTGDLSDKHVLELVLVAHIVQIMLTADFQHEECMEIESDAESQALLRIFKHVRDLAGLTTLVVPSPWQMKQYVLKACLPFLRSVAIFFHFLTGVPSPKELLDSCIDQHSVLCKYLDLPVNLSTLFDNQGTVIQDLVKSWCSDERVKDSFSASSENVASYPTIINQLIDLPNDYSDIINDASTFPCPKSDGDDSRAPTLCLVCGQLLCSQSYCCQTELDNIMVGAATAHAHTCGAGVGLFLRVRECQILLLSGRTKGCFFPPPYLDDYGETDQGLRRGNPLRLCKERYKKLHKLWLSHGIPEEIAHHLESNTNLTTIDWLHL